MGDVKFIVSRANSNSRLSKEDIELQMQRETLEGSRQDRLERKKYATNIFWLLVAFLGATVAIVTLSGLRALCLSDTVIVTLLATTTADVIGIFIFVVKYLFRPHGATGIF
jgi:hypothetical protein